jgi:hypothetical protein
LQPSSAKSLDDERTGPIPVGLSRLRPLAVLSSYDASTAMNDQLHIPDERSLSQEEISLLEWLLGHRRSDVSQYRAQVPKLRVVSRCACGCPTIDFAIGTTRRDGPSHIIADAEGSSPEGVRVGVIVHVREGEISELEVYSVTGEKNAFSLPKPESLVPWPD